MSRIKNVTIMGKEYPLNCSTAAVIRITEKFGGFEKLSETLENSNNDPKAVAKSFEATLWLTGLLLQQGAAYKKVFEGEEINPPKVEELEILLSPADLMKVFPAVMEALNAGMEREVEVAPPKGKNVETASAVKQLAP